MFKDKQVKSLAGGADVTQYMKGTRVSKWLVLALAAVVILCVGIWMSIGTLKTTLPLTGINENGKMVMYVRVTEAIDLSEGQKIEYEGNTVGVITDLELPLSEEQVLASYADKSLVSQLELHQVNVVVRADLDPQACLDGILTVDVVTAEMVPFSLF